MIRKKVKGYVGRMVMLSYRANGYRNVQSGIITAATNQLVVFDINKSGEEIILKYGQIKEIKKCE